MKRELRRKDLHPDPAQQFAVWFKDISAVPNVVLPEAFCLSTVDEDGMPAGRTLLMKDHDERGLTFYTNAESDKGRQLRDNPKAAITFHWKELGRQIRIRGNVERTSDHESDTYFASRPREARIGAWVSQQSRPLASRDELISENERRVKEFEGKDVPRPAYWVGFRIIPVSYEFWQEREHRLHDRFAYLLKGDEWTLQRLYP